MKSLLYSLAALVAFIAGSTAYEVWGLCWSAVIGWVYCGGFIIAAAVNLPNLMRKNGK